MVLSIITLAATVPLLATSTIQLQEQSQKKKDDSEAEFKLEKCHLDARASIRMSPFRREQFHDMRVVLKDGNLILERKSSSKQHPFTGYFLPFPEKSYDGIVTTINAERMLNWIYIDRDSYKLKHGVRADAQPQLTGPMSLKFAQMEDEWRIACQGWEGFVAVEETEGKWAVYFDKDDDGLKAKAAGKDVVELELVRISAEEGKTVSA